MVMAAKPLFAIVTTSDSGWILVKLSGFVITTPPKSTAFGATERNGPVETSVPVKLTGKSVE